MVSILPLPILLLIHIHILEYPHANDPEYDDHVFDAKRRGLRNRTRTMEDLCFFLAGKVHGKPKSLFPTYPCLQPSDSVAFRTALAKYLEGLRNQVVRPDSQSILSASKSSKDKPRDGEPAHVAWWWKDVVVRKSLLEECTGERFERMIIALSTHALFTLTTKSSDLHAGDPSTALSLLKTLPEAYVTLDASIEAARRIWARSASLILQRGADLRSLRDRLLDPTHQEDPYLAALTTDRLLALVQSRQDDLLSARWDTPALKFILHLAGLKPPGDSNDSETLSYIPAVPDWEVVPAGGTFPAALPPPLPTAAAHHPAKLASIRAPVLPAGVDGSALPQGHNIGQFERHTTQVLITERLDSSARTRTALEGALRRAGAQRTQLIAASSGDTSVFQELDVQVPDHGSTEFKPNLKSNSRPGIRGSEESSATLNLDPSSTAQNARGSVIADILPRSVEPRPTSSSTSALHDDHPPAEQILNVEAGDEEVPYEGRSFTLRDILVRAGEQFDILRDGRVDVADQTLGWE